MDDLISRQSTIDALGEEPEVWTGNDEYAQGLNNQWWHDVAAIKAVPSVQPELIRCKDCKHYVDEICDKWDNYLREDFYCGCGERKADE